MRTPALQDLRLTAEGSRVKLAGATTGEARAEVTSSQPLRVAVEGGPTRTCRGSLAVTAKEGRLTLVNVVPLEEYLRGVVPAEMPPSFAPEALKAQVIAARTYALATRGKHAAEGYELCDGTHCQVYLGVEGEDPRVDAAIRETAGLIVTYQGKPIQAVYHDTCGGCTAGNDEAWSGAPVTYLRPVSDCLGVPPVCAASPRARWERRISRAEFVSALSSLGVTGKLGLVAPEGCEDRTRPDRYRVTTDCGEWVVPASKMRTLLGKALSADFIARLEGEEVAITGWGSGHGVGLCQWGANGLAKLGWSAEQILQHYYAGTKVERR